MALAGLDPEVVRSLKTTPSPPKAQPPSRRTRMPHAERAADAELSRCRLLVEAVVFASKALDHAGGRLQEGAKGFCNAEGGDAPLANACQSLVKACGGLGTSLSQLACLLSSGILEPLQEVQRIIDQERDKRRAGLMPLEQKENDCKKLVEETAHRKQMATEQLRTVISERDEVERRGGWFLRKTLSGKLNRQIDEAAAVQDKVVQELSLHVEQLAIANMEINQTVEVYQDVVVEANGRLKKALHPVLLNCAQAWKDTARSIRDGADTLQGGAALLAKEVGGNVGGGRAIDEESDNSTMMDANDGDSHCGSAASPVRPASNANTAAASTAAESTGYQPLTETPRRTGAAAGKASEPAASTIGKTLDWTPSAEARRESNEHRVGDLALAAPELVVEPGAFDDGPQDDDASEESSSYSPAVGANGDVVSEQTSPTHAGSGNAPAKTVQYLEYVASASQGPLGLKLQWPPGPVIIQAVVKGGWAESCGLQKGAEVLTVNGEVVCKMEEVALRDLLKERPLRITLPLPAASEVSSSQEGAALLPQVKPIISAPEVGIDRV